MTRMSAVALVAGLVLAAAAPNAGAALPRSTGDRADDVAGRQIHALYVLPSDGVDRQLDTDGTIDASVANFRAWLTSETAGKELRADTFGTQLDVTFFRLA